MVVVIDSQINNLSIAEFAQAYKAFTLGEGLRYGRIVGRVKVGSTDVNLEMVRRGLAWWYRDFAKNDACSLSVQ